MPGREVLSTFLRVVRQRLIVRISTSKLARRIASGSLWGLWGSVGSRLLSVAAMIILARMLGPTQFGGFGLLQASVGVAGLLAGIGLGTTATRFVARYSGEPDRAGTIIGLLTQVVWALLMAVTIAIVLNAPQIAFHVLGERGLELAIWAGCVLLGSNVLRGVQSGILSGIERFDAVARLNITEGVATLLFVPPFAFLGGMEGGIAALAAAGLLSWLFGERIKIRSLQEKGISIRYRGSWQHWRILAGYSLPSFLATVVATPVLWYAMLILARTSNGHAAVGVYNAAYQWHGPLIFLPMVVMSSSIPALVQEWEHGSRTRFRKATLWLAIITFGVTLIPAFAIAISAKSVMSLYGQEYVDGWSVLILLVLAAPFHALSRIASGALYGMNRAWSAFLSNLVWGLVLLGLAVALIPSYGAFGLAAAFLAAYSVHTITCLTLVILMSGGDANRQSTRELHRSLEYVDK